MGMNKKDLSKIGLQNLLRHKGRTSLTVLGVVIGCASIIIMVSIGIGMKEMQEQTLAQMGDLTIITVSPAGKGQKAAKLDDKAVSTIREMEHVEAATPKVSAQELGLKLYTGSGRRYQMEYGEVVGIDPEAAQKLGYQLMDGGWLTAGSGQLVAGQSFAYVFKDTKRPEGRNMIDPWVFDENGQLLDPPKPYFEVQKAKIVVELPSPKEDGKPYSREFEIVGRVKEDYAKGSETSGGVMMSLKDMNELLEQHRRMSGTANQKRSGYETVLVKVSSIEDVGPVEKRIQKAGFRTSSMESIRKPMEKEAQQKQMMFGGLGAVSLFVAAIGITNTMIMAITERTKEIGIMKSLGCFVNDIRTIFLFEAGCIGLTGGLAGSLLSLLISTLMNTVSGEGGRISVIPWWLFLFAVVFSILIGLGAGYYPANQAVKIPALEAIKSE